MATKTDTADKIAASVADALSSFYPTIPQGNYAVNTLRRDIQNALRSAIRAERTRCVRVIEKYSKERMHTVTRPHPAIVRDELIALINPKQPKPKKQKAVKRG